jgi:hypothetical protein
MTLALSLQKNEISYWLGNLRKIIRSFKPQAPEVVAWVDASDYAVAGIAAILIKKCSPITPDNWLLDTNNAYRRLQNCAQLQVAKMPWLMQKPVIIRDEFDLDPVKIQEFVYCHRNLKYYERVTDSNERELIAAVELI